MYSDFFILNVLFIFCRIFFKHFFSIAEFYIIFFIDIFKIILQNWTIVNFPGNYALVNSDLSHQTPTRKTPLNPKPKLGPTCVSMGTTVHERPSSSGGSRAEVDRPPPPSPDAALFPRVITHPQNLLARKPQLDRAFPLSLFASLSHINGSITLTNFSRCSSCLFTVFWHPIGVARLTLHGRRS